MSDSPWRRLRSTHAWRTLARRTIREEPYCWLKLPGCTRISTTADHVIPISIRPDLALVRANTRGACKSCNYRRGDTSANQLDELRRQTPKQLDEHRARRHIAARHRSTAKTAPAVMFFDPNYQAGNKRPSRARLLKGMPPQGAAVTCGPNDEIPDSDSEAFFNCDPLPQPPQLPPIPLTQSI
jgi:hypothetical protein